MWDKVSFEGRTTSHQPLSKRPTCAFYTIQLRPGSEFSILRVSDAERFWTKSLVEFTQGAGAIDWAVEGDDNATTPITLKRNWGYFVFVVVKFIKGRMHKSFGALVEWYLCHRQQIVFIDCRFYFTHCCLGLGLESYYDIVMTIFIGPRSDHSLPMSVTHSLTD